MKVQQEMQSAMRRKYEAAQKQPGLGRKGRMGASRREAAVHCQPPTCKTGAQIAKRHVKASLHALQKLRGLKVLVTVPHSDASTHSKVALSTRMRVLGEA
jgi:hypothetical protein